MPGAERLQEIRRDALAGAYAGLDALGKARSKDKAEQAGLGVADAISRVVEATDILAREEVEY